MRSVSHGVIKVKIKLLIIAIFVAASFAISTQYAQGQLPRDVQDMFEGMLNDLDDDLRSKFQQAIDNDTATVESLPKSSFASATTPSIRSKVSIESARRRAAETSRSSLNCRAFAIDLFGHRNVRTSIASKH